MDLTQAFEDAAKRVKTYGTQNNATLLKLYSLYKQGTKGDITGEEPSAFDFVAKAKYDAWKSLKGTDPDDAKQQYVGLVDELAKK